MLFIVGSSSVQIVSPPPKPLEKDVVYVGEVEAPEPGEIPVFPQLVPLFDSLGQPVKLLQHPDDKPPLDDKVTPKQVVATDSASIYLNLNFFAICQLFEYKYLILKIYHFTLG